MNYMENDVVEDVSFDVVREQLATPKGVAQLRKALKNRAYRWTLKRQGALDLVEEELRKAEEKIK